MLSQSSHSLTMTPFIGVTSKLSSTSRQVEMEDFNPEEEPKEQKEEEEEGDLVGH